MKDNRNLTTDTEEKKVEKVKEKKPNIFVRMGRRIKGFVRDYVSEMKKVTWMPARDVRKSTFLVCVSVVVIGIAVLAIDTVFSTAFTWLGELY